MKPNENLDEPIDDKPLAPNVSLHDGEENLETRDDENLNAAQSRSTGSEVARATAGIVPMHLARFVIGFLAPILIAGRLGLGAEAKAYSIATEILNRLWQIFEKVVNPSFLPCFIRSLKEDGEERAWKFTSSALSLTVLALCVIIPLAAWQMPAIAGIYVNEEKTSPDQIAMIVSLARWLLLGLGFLSISSLTYVVLNGYKRFASAALGDTLWKLGILVGALAAYALKLVPAQAISVLVFGFVLGSFLKLLPHLVALRGKLKMLRPRVDWSDPNLRRMFALGGPLLIGILVSEARSIYVASLADDAQIQVVAGLAALKWSRMIGDTLLQIFPYALSIGVFPYLAELARERDKQPLTDVLVGALRVCIFAFVPLTTILIALRLPLLRAVWESGNMTQQDTIDLSWPFFAYTLGLVAFACEMLLNQTFYAMTNVWIPTLVGLGTSLLWVVSARVGLDHAAQLAQWLGVPHNLGLAALAGSESFAKTIKCLILWFLLRRHLGKVNARAQAWFAIKVIGGALVAGVVAGLIAHFIAPHGGGKLKMLLAVALSGTGGLIAFLFWCRLTAVEETQSLFAFFGKLRRRVAR